MILRGVLEVDLEAANQVRDCIPVVLDPEDAVLKITAPEINDNDRSIDSNIFDS